MENVEIKQREIIKVVNSKILIAGSVVLALGMLLGTSFYDPEPFIQNCTMSHISRAPPPYYTSFMWEAWA